MTLQGKENIVTRLSQVYPEMVVLAERIESLRQALTTDQERYLRLDGARIALEGLLAEIPTSDENEGRDSLPDCG